eukprot:scaffold106042_cov42-Prasinocladus_malaysianus.AAC.5
MPSHVDQFGEMLPVRRLFCTLLPGKGDRRTKLCKNREQVKRSHQSSWLIIQELRGIGGSRTMSPTYPTGSTAPGSVR